MRLPLALLAVVLSGAALGGEDASFILDAGGSQIAVKWVECDGEKWVPLGPRLKEALRGSVDDVKVRLPFIEMTAKGETLKMAVGLNRVMKGGNEMAWFPDPARFEDGLPVLSARSLACALNSLNVECSWVTPGSHLRLGSVIIPPPRILPKREGNGAFHVVLDPGHGGKDGGACGRRLCEKTVTLDLAKRVRANLREKGFKVTMTRETDVTVGLQERVQMATKFEADLFVSLHVNASRNKSARGVETYIYGAKAQGLAEAELVRRENAESDYVDIIVSDLEQRRHNDSSIRVAGSIEEALVRQSGFTGRSGMRVKEAPFYVLARAKRPAVLIEVGFISNGDEERKLASSWTRQRLSECIATGVAEEAARLSGAVSRRL